MAEAELVDTLEDTEVVRTSIGTLEDTEMDNAVDTCGSCDSDSENVLYSKAVPTSIRVNTYGTRDTNYDSEEDIDMILTSIGTDAFELYNTELDARDTAIVQLEEAIGMPVPARIKECDHMGSNCEGEQNKIELPPSEHATEL